METRLYVGNLPYAATEEQVQERFSQAGNVKSVALISDHVTGRAKGFGFVEMSTVEEAQNAIHLFHGKDFMGRVITVSVARPRKERRKQNVVNQTHGGEQNGE